MIGNDTKLLEDNIDTFLSEFIVDGDSWESAKNLKLRQVLSLYRLFKDLSM